MINVKVKVFLKSPYSKSLYFVYEVANRKGYKILLGHYNANYMLLGLTWKQFKSLFKKNPVIGKEYNSNNSYILKVKVLSIEGI